MQNITKSKEFIVQAKKLWQTYLAQNTVISSGIHAAN
jgi:hypothetical protein